MTIFGNYMEFFRQDLHLQTPPSDAYAFINLKMFYKTGLHFNNIFDWSLGPVNFV